MGSITTFSSPVEECLESGERLLWEGQPKQGVRLQAADAFMIPFSFMWGGFAIFWELAALGLFGFGPHAKGSSHDPMMVRLIFPLWGIPFVVIGLYIMFGRFFYDAEMRKRTWYAITDQRVLILKNLFSRNVVSFEYRNLPGLNLTERRDGSGDILFGSAPPFAAFSGAGWPGTRKYAAPGFYLVPDAREVYSRIRQVQRSPEK